MIEQRASGASGTAPWIVDDGRRMRGVEGSLRIQEIRDGLMRHGGARPTVASVDDAKLRETLLTLHEPDYLRALCELPSTEPAAIAELAPPDLAPDTPVSAELVEAAHEGVRAAIAAAQALLDGARVAYALCRPPGHHAGPGWLAGYCYLNNAAAAARTLREGGVDAVGILDIDLHYPNGTAAMLARIGNARLCSLHASPVRNVACEAALPLREHEQLVAFAEDPDPESYLQALAASLDALAASTSALVVSLGYDTVQGDPHGCWSFHPAVFERIGSLLGACGRPLCVVQEGGYELGSLAACAEAFASGLLDGRR